VLEEREGKAERVRMEGKEGRRGGGVGRRERSWNF
jgi:hypothetical protein